MLEPLFLLNAAGQRPSPFLTPPAPCSISHVQMWSLRIWRVNYHVNSSIRDLSVCGFWYLLGFWNQSLAHTEG